MYICTRDIRDGLKTIKDISSNINVIVLGVCRRLDDDDDEDLVTAGACFWRSCTDAQM